MKHMSCYVGQNARSNARDARLTQTHECVSVRIV